MTEPIEPTPLEEPTASWAPVVEPTEEPADTVGDVSDDELDPRTRAYVAKLKKESQGLRARLRDAEEQVGAASARENVHTREQVAAAAAQAGLIDGNDLFIAHPDPNEFLDEQFRDVIGSRVAAATQSLLEQKPYLGRPVGAPPTQRPLEGLRPGAAPEPKAPTTPSWSAALHGRNG
jgi:hypothetical protein